MLRIRIYIYIYIFIYIYIYIYILFESVRAETGLIEQNTPDHCQSHIRHGNHQRGHTHSERSGPISVCSDEDS
jgi:hypothetical protein